MAANLLKTSTSEHSPLDGSGEEYERPKVSDFLTIQSLSNFSAMTGAISGAMAINSDETSTPANETLRAVIVHRNQRVNKKSEQEQLSLGSEANQSAVKGREKI